MRTATLIAFAITLTAPAIAPARASSFFLQPQVREPRITVFHDISRQAFPECITVGPDGNLWATEELNPHEGGAVVRIDLRGRRTGTFHYGPTYYQGRDIVTGADGALWIADGYDNQLVRMTTDGKFRLIPAPSGPIAVTPGPDGNIWFAGLYLSPPTVGKVTPSGQITTYSSGIATGLQDITEGPDGALWFTEYGAAVGRITTDGVVTEYRMGIPHGAHPTAITAGPDGNLWFTEPDNSAIARITPAGFVTQFTQGITGDPTYLATGRSEALWFTEHEAEKIGRITINGLVTEYSKGISPLAMPGCIIRGPDGNMWFTEVENYSIGRVKL